MAATAKLKVQVSYFDAGGLGLTLDAADAAEPLALWVSYVYNSPGQPIEALGGLLLPAPATAGYRVLLPDEPDETELHFQGHGAGVALTARAFADGKHRAKTGRELLRLSGSYAEICLPFWRALRGLQGQYPPAKLDRRWHRAFPSRALNQLTALLPAAGAVARG